MARNRENATPTTQSEILKKGSKRLKKYRKKVLEVICRENELLDKRKKQSKSTRISSSPRINKSDSDSSCSEFESKFKTWKENHFNCRAVNYQNLLVFTKVLEKEMSENRIVKEQQLKDRRYCQSKEICALSYDAAVYVFKAIRKCILLRDWSTVTKLLPLLLHKNGRYYGPYIKQICTLSVLMNPADTDGKLRTQFLQLMRGGKTDSQVRDRKASVDNATDSGIE